MLKNLCENIETFLKDDIIGLFDELSLKHYWTPETENNIYYYNGKATNKSIILIRKLLFLFIALIKASNV